eukprot:Skav223065  [mRNA]  locus=scaffold419:8031:9914:- [translate_table: standard]
MTIDLCLWVNRRGGGVLHTGFQVLNISVSRLHRLDHLLAALDIVRKVDQNAFLDGIEQAAEPLLLPVWWRLIGLSNSFNR